MGVLAWVGFAVFWSVSGVWGARIIVDLWFSGGLLDLRPKGLPLEYVILGLLFGPINLLLAGAWWAMGMGRS